MTLSPKIFREYDIRGRVGEDLGEEDAYLIGQGFGTVVSLNGGRKVCVGYDGRLSSPKLETALVKGLVAAGMDVLRVGLGPTPLVYFANHSLKADGAVMITGSHNPKDFNGFKMVLKNAPFYGEQIQSLRERIESKQLTHGLGSIQDVDVQPDYRTHLLKDFNEHYLSERPGLKVAWDAGNGATGDLLKTLLPHLPGHHILLNETIDGTFPAHHPDPVVAENLKQLQETVLHEECDLGIAFDGDGDRLGVVDNKSNILWGDQLMVLYASEVLKDHPHAVIIGDVKASQVLFDKIKEMGGTPLMWRTGHSLIKVKMTEVNSPLAGEMSGHIFFKDRYFGFDDALYAALRTIGIVGHLKQPLSEWRQTLPNVYNTPELRIPCEHQNKFKVVDGIKETLIAKGIAFDGIDGVRVLSNKGWWLLRASNTQEELVARVEAASEKELDLLKDHLEFYLNQNALSLKPTECIAKQS
jgi:phosphomannomutase